MTVRQISISEFKAHCTEEIRAVEKGDLLLELTRHGKTAAVVQPPCGSLRSLARRLGRRTGDTSFLG